MSVVVAGGVEHMTRGPWVMSKTSKAFGRDMTLHDTSFGWRFINPKFKKFTDGGDGPTAENLVELHGISREDQDAFAHASQMKAAAAQNEGRFAEIVSCPSQGETRPAVFSKDEFIKPGTTLEVLSASSCVQKGGRLGHCGERKGLNDGAAALLLASEEGLQAHGLEPLAQIVSSAVVGAPADHGHWAS